MQTDIWALGVCVYEMVALSLPDDVPEIQQLVLNTTHDEVRIMYIKLIKACFKIRIYYDEFFSFKK